MLNTPKTSVQKQQKLTKEKTSPLANLLESKYNEHNPIAIHDDITANTEYNMVKLHPFTVEFTRLYTKELAQIELTECSIA